MELIIKCYQQVDAWVAGDCCDTLVPAIFANVSQCFPHEHINTSGSIASENQLDGLINCIEIFVEEATVKTFEAMDKFLAANRNSYDVMVHDYFVLGAEIAARIHKMPVVCAYIGYALLVFEDEKHNTDVEDLVYAPESKMPGFVHDIKGAFAALLWHHTISKKQFRIVQSLFVKHGIEHLDENENDGAYPFSYYFRRAVLIHSGMDVEQKMLDL